MAVKKQKKKRVDKPVKPVVEIKNLTVRYDNDACAHGVDFLENVSRKYDCLFFSHGSDELTYFSLLVRI